MFSSFHMYSTLHKTLSVQESNQNKVQLLIMKIFLKKGFEDFIESMPENTSVTDVFEKIASLNTSFSNELEEFIDSMPLGLKITHGIFFLISEISTFVCYSGFIHYEYYGGDPAKRSMKNKLWAQLCYCLLVMAMTSSPAYAWRILIGPLNECFAISILFIRCFIGIYLYLCFTEIVLYKVVMALSWKSFSLMNEEMVFIFLISFNILFSFGGQFSLWMLEHYGSVHYELLANTFDKKFYEKPVFWPIFLIFLGLIMVIGIVIYLSKKCYDYNKNKNLVQEIHIGLDQQNPGPGNHTVVNRFNNNNFNEALLNATETIFCVILASVSLATFLLITQIDFDNVN